MYKVVISPSANADLFNALKYSAYELENQQAAAKLADGIGKAYSALEEFPAAHEVRVVHVFHALQNYLDILNGEI